MFCSIVNISIADPTTTISIGSSGSTSVTSSSGGASGAGSGSGTTLKGIAGSGANTGATPCVNNPLFGINNEDLLGSDNFTQCLDPGVDKTYAYKYLIPYIIKKILEIGAGVAVLMIVYSGILYLSIGIDTEQKGTATKNIIFEILGLLIMILARAIVSIVENLPLG